MFHFRVVKALSILDVITEEVIAQVQDRQLIKRPIPTIQEIIQEVKITIKESKKLETMI